jgi:hypothetical protein
LFVATNYSGCAIILQILDCLLSFKVSCDNITTSTGYQKLKLPRHSSSTVKETDKRNPNPPCSTIKMDELLHKLLSFPPHPPSPRPLSDQAYDEGIREQIDVINKMSDVKLLQQTSGGEHALDVCLEDHDIYRWRTADNICRSLILLSTPSHTPASFMQTYLP